MFNKNILAKGEMKIQAPIDNIFNFIERHSPVREGSIPKKLKRLKHFEEHMRILESNGMIEIKAPLLSSERIFVFKTREREFSPWGFGL